MKTKDLTRLPEDRFDHMPEPKRSVLLRERQRQIRAAAKVRKLREKHYSASAAKRRQRRLQWFDLEVKLRTHGFVTIPNSLLDTTGARHAGIQRLRTTVTNNPPLNLPEGKRRWRVCTRTCADGRYVWLEPA